MTEAGLIHVYCGDGKGKTTAAAGLAARCAGSGGRVLFFQFLKDNSSGERKSLAAAGVTLIDGAERAKFVWSMTEDEKRGAADFYGGKFKELTELAPEYDMLVMDEIFPAVRYGFVPIEAILAFLENKPQGLEVVMTGREPDERLLNKADYVSEIKKRAHPYDKGIKARKMIEY